MVQAARPIPTDDPTAELQEVDLSDISHAVRL